jgi:hypothetical protein
MKLIIVLLLCLSTTLLLAAVPTDEGLLRNPNNSELAGDVVTLKAEVRKLTGNADRVDHYKFVFSLEDKISLFQINYSGSQMLNAQIQDVKLIADLNREINKDRSIDRGMFYATISMLALNESQVMETFIGRTGSSITKNKQLINEEKIKLLRTYKSYLSSKSGKGEASSPLNPESPEAKARVVEVFKSNTFNRSKNIELVRENGQYLWKADWKSVRAFFTNEEKRLKYIEFVDLNANAKIEVQDYALLNNVNEFPRTVLIKDSQGDQYKMTFYFEEVKKKQEKSLSDRFKDASKSIQKQIDSKEIFSFIF